MEVYIAILLTQKALLLPSSGNDVESVYYLHVVATEKPEITFNNSMTTYDFSWDYSAETQPKIQIPTASAKDKYYSERIFVAAPKVVNGNGKNVSVSLSSDQQWYEFIPTTQGKYTVTYTANGKWLSNTKSFTLNIGDVEAPTLAWKDKDNDFKHIVEANDTWIFKFSMIEVEDNKDEMSTIINNILQDGVTSTSLENLKPYVEVTMVRDGELIPYEIVGNGLEFTFDIIGDYKFKIKLTDTSGNSSGDEYTYTITAQTRTSPLPKQKIVNVGSSWIFKYSMIEVTDNVDDMQSLINSILKKNGETLTQAKIEKLKKYVELSMTKDGKPVGYTISENGLKYTFNSLGDYIFKIKLTDKAGNSSGDKYTYTITAKDLNAPVLTWRVKPDCFYNTIEVFDTWTFKFSMVSIVDNVDNINAKIQYVLKKGLTAARLKELKDYVEITMTKDGSAVDYEIVGNGLKFNFDSIGNYIFTIRLKDSAGNSTGTKYRYLITTENRVKMQWKNIEKDLVKEAIGGTRWTFRFDMVDISDSYYGIKSKINDILTMGGQTLTSNKLKQLNKYFSISLEYFGVGGYYKTNQKGVVREYEIVSNGLQFRLSSEGVYKLKIVVSDGTSNSVVYTYEILIKSQTREFSDYGVTILDQNGINPKWDIDVTQVANKNISAKKLKSAIKKKGKICLTYDIEVVENLAAAKLDKPIAVTINIPESLVGEKLKVVYISDDGKTIEDMDAFRYDNTLVFSTNHFSQYALVKVEESEETNTDTSKILAITLSVASVVLSAATVLCVVLINKKKSK